MNGNDITAAFHGMDPVFKSILIKDKPALSSCIAGVNAAIDNQRDKLSNPTKIFESFINTSFDALCEIYVVRARDSPPNGDTTPPPNGDTTPPPTAFIFPLSPTGIDHINVWEDFMRRVLNDILIQCSTEDRCVSVYIYPDDTNTKELVNRANYDIIAARRTNLHQVRYIGE